MDCCGLLGLAVGHGIARDGQGADNAVQDPKIVNGCSDLFVEVFGERGRHARSAVGMSSLPGGIPVEIEVIVAVK